MGRPDYSIVITTWNKADLLEMVLESIAEQRPTGEIIVADDGSTDRTPEVIRRFGYRHIRLEKDVGYRNPSRIRNAGYRAARGEMVISQSDDVLHHTPGSIEKLLSELRPGHHVIATVYDYHLRSGRRGRQFTGPRNRRSIFFLGALWLKDIYAIGGNDEEFTEIGYEDIWFADCLTKGLGSVPIWLDVVGLHIRHRRPNRRAALRRSRALLLCKRREGNYISSGGPWRFDPPA